MLYLKKLLLININLKMLKWLHILIYLNKIIKFDSFSYLLIDFIIEMYQSGPNGPKCYVDVVKLTI